MCCCKTYDKTDDLSKQKQRISFSKYNTAKMDKRNIVICLFEGYSVVQAEKNQMLANCTCTLIKSKNGNNILVDTMTPWDREKLIQGIRRCSTNLFRN